MVSSSFPARASSLVRDNRRILSKASEALEISSRRKIFRMKSKELASVDLVYNWQKHEQHEGLLTSLFLYKELMISFIILFTSALNACFSDFSRISFICEAFKPSSWMASSSLLEKRWYSTKDACDMFISLGTYYYLLLGFVEQHTNASTRCPNPIEDHLWFL